MADNPNAADQTGSAAEAAAAGVAKLHLDEATGEMISKSELKKRQKLREKEAAKKEKAAANPKPQTTTSGSSSSKNAEAAEKELTPNQVRILQTIARRTEVLTALHLAVLRDSIEDCQ